MSEVSYYTARPEGSEFEYEMVMSTDYEATAEDRDAQRLRADTAEAELKREREFNAVNVSEAERMLAAAEQRIAILSKALTDIRENSEDLGACECAADALKDAALNPNPEAESHE